MASEGVTSAPIAFVLSTTKPSPLLREPEESEEGSFRLRNRVAPTSILAGRRATINQETMKAG